MAEVNDLDWIDEQANDPEYALIWPLHWRIRLWILHDLARLAVWRRK
jgi:hypothetical protein